MPNSVTFSIETTQSSKLFETSFIDLASASTSGIYPKYEMQYKYVVPKKATKAKAKAGKLAQRRMKKKSTSMETVSMSDEQLKLNEKDIVSSIEVKALGGRTHLFAIVKDIADPRKNQQRAVPCGHGTPFSRGYPYDQTRDAYLIECIASDYLGYVACVYAICIPGTGWQSHVPLPDQVIDRMISPAIKRKLIMLREAHPAKQYELQIVQMSGCEF